MWKTVVLLYIFVENMFKKLNLFEIYFLWNIINVFLTFDQLNAPLVRKLLLTTIFQIVFNYRLLYVF